MITGRSKLAAGEKITFVKKNASVGFEPASIGKIKIFGRVGKSRSWALYRRTETRCCWNGHTISILRISEKYLTRKEKFLEMFDDGEKI